MNITPILLKDISCDLENNTLWGLARLNEYTESTSLLRLALLRRFKSEIDELVNNSNTKAIVNKLLTGSLLIELEHSDQEFVKELCRNMRANNYRNFSFKTKVSHQQRKMILNRACKIAS
jgi:hypothetical protein